MPTSPLPYRVKGLRERADVGIGPYGHCGSLSNYI